MLESPMQNIWVIMGITFCEYENGRLESTGLNFSTSNENTSNIKGTSVWINLSQSYDFPQNINK